MKDPEPFLFHAEIVLRDGVPVGYVTSGAYAFTLGGAAGLFMIKADQPVDEAYVSERDVGSGHRRDALPGRGLAQADVRSRDGEDQGLRRSGLAIAFTNASRQAHGLSNERPQGSGACSATGRLPPRARTSSCA